MSWVMNLKPWLMGVISMVGVRQAVVHGRYNHGS